MGIPKQKEMAEAKKARAKLLREWNSWKRKGGGMKDFAANRKVSETWIYRCLRRAEGEKQ